MAEHGARATAEHRRHPFALPRELRPPDGIDPSVHPVQPALSHAMPDRVLGEAELTQLVVRQDVVLSSSQGPRPRLKSYGGYSRGKSSVVGFSPRASNRAIAC